MTTTAINGSSQVKLPVKNSQNLDLVNSPRTLSNLPTEVLIKITENLCAHCTQYCVEADIKSIFYHLEAQEGRKAIQEFCLVARKYKAIAQPILYHYYCYNTGVPDVNVDRLISLLRTITNRADLADSIRILSLDSMDEPEESQHSVIGLNQTTAEILDEISRPVKILPSIGRPVALLKTLTIAAVSESLQYLSYGIEEGLVPRSLLESITCLPRLQVFNFCIDPARERLDYSLFISFHNLDVFKISSRSPTDHFDWPAELASGQMKMPNFHRLISENMGLSGLFTFLLNYPKLYDLEIFLNSREEGLSSSTRWEDKIGSFSSSLRSLRRLVISPNNLRFYTFLENTPQDNDEETNSPKFTLTKFSKLEILETNLDLLLWLSGGNLTSPVPFLLPPSLRTLHLSTTQSWKNVSKHLQNLATAKVGGCLPELATICLEYNGLSNAYFPRALPLETIKEMEIAGLKWSLLYNAYESDEVADSVLPFRTSTAVWRLEPRFFL